MCICSIDYSTIQNGPVQSYRPIYRIDSFNIFLLGTMISNKS